MASLLDALLGRPAQSIDELNGSKLGQIAQRFKYANNPVGTETNHQIGLGPVDRLMEVAQSPQVQNMVQIGSGMGDGGGVGMIRAYHGSPHKFDRFDLSRIGTGEGAQAYGHGLYFAGNEGVARSYRDKLANAQFPPPEVLEQYFKPGSIVPSYGGFDKVLSFDPSSHNVVVQGADKAGNLLRYEPVRSHSTMPDWRQVKRVFADRGLPDPQAGSMYEVNINAKPEQLLDWDKPLGQQSAMVRETMRTLGVPERPHVMGEQAINHIAGEGMLEREGLLKMLRNKAAEGDTRSFPEYEAQIAARADPQVYAAGRLRDAGIPGIQYLDAGSRNAGEGSRNYVIFDDKLIDILRRYAFPGMVATGAMAAVPGESQ